MRASCKDINKDVPPGTSICISVEGWQNDSSVGLPRVVITD